MNQKTLRPIAFWPPFLLLIAALILSLTNQAEFIQTLQAANQWIIKKLDWVFCLGAVSFLATVIFAYCSPLGHIKIGGENAKPMLSQWRWFSITLCTTIAIGIVFWASAEPLYHLHYPPESLGIKPGSPAAEGFALSTLYMHWTFIPYAIYTVPALMFALSYYNLNSRYNLSAPLMPLFGKQLSNKPSQLIDAICLYALVAGMAASLASGVLSISGGIEYLWGIPNNANTQALITAVIVLTFIASASTGLMKGIRVLSDLNAKIFFILAGLLFLIGPTTYILNNSFSAVGEYIGHFFERSLLLNGMNQDGWGNSWTIFYWANWLAWAPVTALFLGRIAYGYTVKQFIRMNLLYPALFGCLWMSIFGGTSLFFEDNLDGALIETLNNHGPESVIYTVFEQYPLANLLALAFIVTAFISYVTASDSNTEAMAGICTHGISPERPDSPISIKVVWGAAIGIISWVMVSYAGIDGIKLLSTLGGFPALLLILLINLALLKTILKQYQVAKSSQKLAVAR